MITGSGTQNRDEEIFGFKLFRVIADHLTRQGIAVLRCDDRGLGAQGGFGLDTTADFASDVIAQGNFLRGRSQIDPQRVGLFGHSEGGIIAPLANQKSPFAFMVLMAGTAVKGEDVLLEQDQPDRSGGRHQRCGDRRGARAAEAALQAHGHPGRGEGDRHAHCRPGPQGAGQDASRAEEVRSPIPRRTSRTPPRRRCWPSTLLGSAIFSPTIPDRPSSRRSARSLPYSGRRTCRSRRGRTSRSWSKLSKKGGTRT